MTVNSGSNAIKILQSMLNDFGADVIVDGALGPHSLAAAPSVWEKTPAHLADAYGIERRNYYYRLADKRKKLRKYARRRDGGKGGWIIRAEEFIHARFHLSLTQHQQRTAKWA